MRRPFGRGRRARLLPVALIAAALLAASALTAGDPVVCKVCGLPIDGEYVALPDGAYHRACWLARKAPRCGVCGEPIEDSYVAQEGKTYHQACYEKSVALRCSLCGGVINGEYSRDFWQNLYHKSHASEVPECTTCGRLISERTSGGGVRYPDGRHVCGICRRSAVDDLDAARQVLVEAAAALAGHGIEIPPEGVRLVLVDLPGMKKVSGDGSGRSTGFTEYRVETGSMGEKSGEEADLYLLAGMPRAWTLRTLSHELTHVWQGRRGRLDISSSLREGSANYAAWLVLSARQGKEYEYLRHLMDKDPDPDYGEGFRRLRRWAEPRPARAWLRMLETRSSIP